MGTPEPYAPCPCGSGTRYKFCCRPRGRFKESPVLSEVEDEPELGFAPAGRFGIADGMAAYAQPLLDRTDGSAEDIEKAMSIAMLCWNLAILPDAEHDEFLAEMSEAIQMDPEIYRDFRREVIEPMIRRHWKMFSEMDPRRRQMLLKSQDSSPSP